MPDRWTTTIVIPVGGAASGFSPQTVSVERGGALTVVNNDNVTHSVTSDAVGTQGDPLFDLVIPSHATRTLVIPPDLGAGAVRRSTAPSTPTCEARWS